MLLCNTNPLHVTMYPVYQGKVCPESWEHVKAASLVSGPGRKSKSSYGVATAGESGNASPIGAAAEEVFCLLAHQHTWGGMTRLPALP